MGYYASLYLTGANAHATAKSDDVSVTRIKVQWTAAKHTITPGSDEKSEGQVSSFDAVLSGDLTDTGSVSINAEFFNVNGGLAGTASASATYTLRADPTNSTPSRMRSAAH